MLRARGCGPAGSCVNQALVIWIIVIKKKEDCNYYGFVDTDIDISFLDKNEQLFQNNTPKDKLGMHNYFYF